MSDPALMGPLVEWRRQELVNLRERLELLESGRVQLGRRKPGSRWEDMTPRVVELIKRNIAELESLIAQYGGNK